MGHWTLEDIQWDRFDPSKVDGDLIKVIKAAALVEKNGRDYARYLQEVFADDPEFVKDAWIWGDEEVQHGDALGRWAELADPAFDFQTAFSDFAATIKLPEQVDRSVRGSKTGELVSRCLVECGTSSMYAALAKASDEPVLKQICQKIAADELRHYKLFYSYEKRYLNREKIGRWKRFWVAMGRARETEDDELAYAYYAANHNGDGPYDRKAYNTKYAARIYAYYELGHVERATAMAFKAIGLKPHGRLSKILARGTFALMRHRARRGQAVEARAAAAA
ncbi:MAG: ferritin-like domain-containing protein [Bauldia litoralis]